MDFKKFIRENKNKINTLSEKNCKRNEVGKVVIEKNDDWANETEWDDLYSNIKKEAHYEGR